MKIPNVTIQQLLEAGVHLGHKTLRWNPKMKKYIFGKRDSIHIIDLTQTLELTKIALEKVYETVSNNGKILFVSTKKQASEAIAIASDACFFVDTNRIFPLFDTVSYTFSKAILVSSSVWVKSIIWMESLFPKIYFFILGFHLNVL